MKTRIIPKTSPFLRRALLLFVALSILLLSSCVHNEEIAYLNDQVITLTKRVAEIQESQGAIDREVSRELDAKLDNIRANQASVVADIDQLRTQLTELNGRIEDNEQVMRLTVERDLGDQNTVQTNLDSLNEKVARMEATLNRHQEYLGLGALSPEERVPQEQAGIEAAVPAAPKAAIPDELSLYNGSMALFKEGRYEEAMDGFMTFLKQFPKSDRADNAQFWVGESHWSLKQYEQAILAYQEVIKKHPKGNKVPSAMLRQGMAFLEIQDKTAAKARFREVVKKYPKSNEARIAQQKLNTLK